MKKTLFVAGLDFALTEEQVKGVFGEHGTVASVKIITDKFTNRSRGFGFIEMSTQEEAQECIRILNNATVNSRQIVVKFKEDKPAANNSRGGYNNRW